jgi:hypothetical protein
MTKADFARLEGNYNCSNGAAYNFYPIDDSRGGLLENYDKKDKARGTEYILREDRGNLYLTWFDREFLVSKTSKGFDLISAESGTYRFTKIGD